MIQEKQTNAAILTDGEEVKDSIQMSLDLDSAHVLMQMLSKNLYSDAIGSTIRETASNALDSHRSAGVDKPIIVTFRPTAVKNYEFSVEDFGSGLDDNEVRDIISKYGKSTRRNSADMLGMMGLGFKAPLAYTSSFHFRTRKNGIERKYMMYEGENNNMIDLLYEQSTTEPDGLKVMVPVKSADAANFIDKIKEQLAYFENVYFDVPDILEVGFRYNGTFVQGAKGVKNNFSILRSEHYQISELYSGSEMHICLDNVYYPIDFDKLGIKEINVPIGLRFGLTDGIFPTPNREAIRYTQEAKKAIADKIKTIADEFMTEYNKSLIDNDLLKIIQYYKQDRRNITIAGKEYNVEDLLKYSSIKMVSPTAKDVHLLDLKAIANNSNIFAEYECKFSKASYNNRLAESRGYEKHINILSGAVFYRYDERLSEMKKVYLKEKVFPSGRTIHLIKKVRDFSMLPTSIYDVANYETMLNLGRYRESDKKIVIAEFRMLLDTYMESIPSIDDIVIPEEWLKMKRAQSGYVPKVRRTKLKGEIVGKVGTDLEKATGNNCKFVPTVFQLEDLHKNPYLMVYTRHENFKALDKLYTATHLQKIKLVTFSDREIKTLSKLGLHNVMPLEEFMKGKSMPFRRTVTAYLIEKLKKDYGHVFNYYSPVEYVSSSLRSKIDILGKYHKKHWNKHMYNLEIPEMLQVATTYGYYDENIYSTYKEVKTLLDKFPFINNMFKFIVSEKSNLMPALRDLFKYHKIKMDYQWYGEKGQKIEKDEDEEEEDDYPMDNEINEVINS